MSDRKTFEYGGYHFTPIRKFYKKEGDFFAISKRLASDPNLGMCTYQERQKVPYDYKGFYAISTDKECDVFRCEENGLLYVPGKNELFIYYEPKQKKRNSIAGPPFIQHIARTVQRKADLILRVIVGAKLRNQLSDRSPLRAVQFSLCHNAYLSGALLCRPLEIPVVSVTFLGCERASAIEFRFFCFGSW